MKGIVLIAFGILYLMKPNLFQRGIFMKYSNPASTKTPEEYRRYMQKVAIILIVTGLLLLAYDNRQVFMKKAAPGKQYSENVDSNYNIQQAPAMEQS